MLMILYWIAGISFFSAAITWDHASRKFNSNNEEDVDL